MEFEACSADRMEGEGMKKEYIKPMVMVEGFALSQSIARNCGSTIYQDNPIGYPNYQDIGSCGWVYTEGGEDDPFAGSDVQEPVTYIYWSDGCQNPVGPDFEIEGACYNNPGGGTGIFGSA